MEVWLAALHRYWSAFVDALERHLDRTEQQEAGTPARETKP
jgi:hypothetical protein